ncbi:SMI1/KNR4 family protein [Terribacillus sp. DMT04]|uniref:SMI1/KNR4 family protein n=1 Tax=Terribacillus sp. DMT04 TaxID=2850441 RepID=UPI001C2BDA35|nr:SMI1/KNR4 family protein [Terribacillus sp. DMT04]QXE00908.1 SMI1/KNR4 family protein [Terribacillus sp. DMT04]
MNKNTTLWQGSEAEDYYPVLKITSADLKAYEDVKGIELPSLYKEHILVKNGGKPVLDSIPTNVPTTWASDHANVNVLFGLRSDDGILDTDTLIKEWNLPENIVVFAMSEDNAFFYFDYSSQKENPPIKIYEPEGNLKAYEVAKDYETFITSLYKESLDPTDDEIEAALQENEDKWSDKGLFEKYIAEDNLKELLEGITFYSTSEDLDWVIKKIIDLSESKHSAVRVAAAELILSIVEYNYEDINPKLIEKAIDVFDCDTDPDVQSYMEDIKENM